MWGISPPAKDKLIEELQSSEFSSYSKLHILVLCACTRSWKEKEKEAFVFISHITICFIENPVSVRISWTITRESNNPPSVQPIAIGKGEDIELLPEDENREYLMNMINGTQTKPVKIKAIFPKFLKVKNNGKAEVANDMNQGDITSFWK